MKFFSLFSVLVGRSLIAYRSSYNGPAFFFTANGSHLSDALHGHLLVGRARNSKANENVF